MRAGLQEVHLGCLPNLGDCSAGSETHLGSPFKGLHFLDPIHMKHTREVGV